MPCHMHVLEELVENGSHHGEAAKIAVEKFGLIVREEAGRGYCNDLRSIFLQGNNGATQPHRRGKICLQRNCSPIEAPAAL